MHYNVLGQTDIRVSQICLGTMTFGEQNSSEQAFAQMDMAVDFGVNFFDTAEMYSIPARAETYGRTESIIGQWLKKSGRRDQLVIASKVVGKADDWMPYIRDGHCRLNKENITAAIEQSLKRLQTDYIDLYQVHWPDRNTTYFGRRGYTHEPDASAATIEETLTILDELVKSGKVRTIGISNETPWGMMRYLQLSEQENLTRIVSIQNPYNLLNRSFETGLSEFTFQEQVGLLAYSPLGFGVLTGKYLEAAPENARLTLFPQYKRYQNPNGLKATHAYVELARKHQLSPAQMALAFINQQDFVTSNIIGATTCEQLQENILSIDVQLSDEILDEIDAIYQLYPNPCP